MLLLDSKQFNNKVRQVSITSRSLCKFSKNHYKVKLLVLVV